MKRPIIIHFHIFKNAGTSVDRVLEQNFNDGWAKIESPDSHPLDLETLLDFVRANPHINAVSTHTAVVKAPILNDLKIIPICFVRHPIDRIRSAFDFERAQSLLTPSVIQAKKGTFRDYMDWYLASPPAWQVSNFHAYHFKDFLSPPAPTAQALEQRTLQAVHSMPWLGLVEKFDASMERMAHEIHQFFPDYKTLQANTNRTTNVGTELEENLEAFRLRIGSDTYQRLRQLNAIDFQIYEIVRQRYSTSSLG